MNKELSGINYDIIHGYKEVNHPLRSMVTPVAGV